MLGDALVRFQPRISRAGVGSDGERANSGSWGRRGFGGGEDGGERAVPVVDAYFVPWFDGNGPEAVRFVGLDVEGVW